ncbi:MAG: GAF and HD-GYP domain-containing protein [Myxococcota bacterium]
MIDSNARLKELLEINQELTQLKDLDLLLDHILKKARRFTNADAGSIYIVENDKLRFKSNQNDTLSAKLPKGKRLIFSSFSIPIDNRSISGYVALSGEILNIPDVYRLSTNVPYHFDSTYDEISGYRTHSMLTIPLKNMQGTIVGVLQLINAQNSRGEIIPFSREDEPLIIYFANAAALAIERAKLTRNMIIRMINMAGLRDPKETGSHVNRVGSYSVEIYEVWAKRQGIEENQIYKNKDILRLAAMLHDVGKVAIPDSILKKPARFTPEEYDIMKGHTSSGARLFSERLSELDEASYIVALEHHERWDGMGYPGHINPITLKSVPGYEGVDGKPRGKKGTEIHPFGRVVAIADVYDALSSKRVYKEAWSEDRVLTTIKEESGKQFDPDMIEAFFDALDIIKNISEKYPEE